MMRHLEGVEISKSSKPEILNFLFVSMKNKTQKHAKKINKMKAETIWNSMKKTDFSTKQTFQNVEVLCQHIMVAKLGNFPCSRNFRNFLNFASSKQLVSC